MKADGRIGMVHDGAWDDTGYRCMPLGPSMVEHCRRHCMLY